jgi:predicted amidohydrolase YtcJ
MLFYFCGFARGQNPTPDLILFNEDIFTRHVVRPYVEALAIPSERIIAADDSAGIKSLARKSN